MAISKLTYPNAGGAAVYPDDYNKQNALLLALLSQGNDGLKLTEWTTTAVLPKISLGAYVRHNGAFYIVTDTDYTIQGTAPSADGTYYIKLVGTGDTITAEWLTSVSGFTFNVVKNGWYNSSDEQLIEEGVIKSGSTYYNFKFIDKERRSTILRQDNKIVTTNTFDTGNITSSGTTKADILEAVTKIKISTDLEIIKGAANLIEVPNNFKSLEKITATKGVVPTKSVTVSTALQGGYSQASLRTLILNAVEEDGTYLCDGLLLGSSMVSSQYAIKLTHVVISSSKTVVSIRGLYFRWNALGTLEYGTFTHTLTTNATADGVCSFSM